MPQRLWQVVMLLGAGLLGLGLILWLAANWDDFGRIGRFTLLQALVAVGTLAAIARPARSALHLPAALGALLATGGLLAYFGQTYQTGADPWQLFALWAVLSLPLALAARSETLWLPWCLVAMTAVALWAQTHAGSLFLVKPQQLRMHATAWALAAAVTAALAPWARRFTGAGPWSFRLALILSVLLISGTALVSLFAKPAPQYPIALLLLAATVFGFARARSFDLFALSTAMLALDTLLVAGLARWLFEGPGDAIAHLLLLGLAAAALLAVSVRWVQRRAQACGAWPGAATTTAAAPGDRPWPVVLLTGLGAWLAALPLLGFLGLLLGDWVYESTGPYLVAGLLLALAGTLLRRPRPSVFLEQLALPPLLAGLGLLGYGLARDLPVPLAAGLQSALMVALAWRAGAGQRWLSASLGAAAAGAAMLALHGADGSRLDGTRLWLALHGTLGLGLAARVLMHQRTATRNAAAVGWLALTLAGLAAASGMTFLAAGVLGPAGTLAAIASGSVLPAARWTHVGSVLLALAAAAIGAYSWTTLRRWSSVGLALVAAVLCAFLPMLGGVLLASVLAARIRHNRLATSGALAAVWIIGSFYYALDWPLAYKAVVLAACGAGLAALAWHQSRTRGHGPTTVTAHGGRARLLLALAGVSTLLVVNIGIWHKQTLIAQGQPLYVALAPVDPRSLMQGDFMRLAFQLPQDPQSRLAQLLPAQRPQVVARRDALGVAQLLRIAAPGEPLAPDELAVTLTLKGGRWTLVTDAWFFREGDAAHFAQARYGEFRVDAGGNALLVGLADTQLRPLP